VFLENSILRGRVVVVSACLVGLHTRYDGRSKPVSCVELNLNCHNIVPLCPEQLGGLSTPRPPAEIRGGDGFDVLEGKARVMTRDGLQDVTDSFVAGAHECLYVVKMIKASEIVLKAGSPSCGVSGVSGVTAALLMRAGFNVREV
jgi:uncharacterized protein YbbK (DUF523 family)